ncbi:MAG: tryptophan--tRNA ligase [Rickettsiales bacterium]|nr:tryptophan--tRNA ligase [Rickettsiales bacterium]
MNNQRVFSGIQPTGIPHLGNYLGAIRHWVGLQESMSCLYCVVDLHAITVARPAAQLRQDTREMAAALIACGIDPQKSIIFNQSAVIGHTELGWILGCHTPLGWLNRMTQFKDKAGKDKERASLGLYGYPVLQAADILLYKATHVPVGEDQKQHLELSRDIAGAFNRSVGEEFFPLPEPMIMGEAARVMNLRDGKRKMSKSDESDMTRINLSDSDETIRQKLRKAKSDMLEGISWDPENRPEAANFISIYAAITGQTTEQATAESASLNFSSFKERLSDALIAHLAPIRIRLEALLAAPDTLDKILATGAERAAAIATPHLSEIKRLAGFL